MNEKLMEILDGATVNMDCIDWGDVPEKVQGLLDEIERLTAKVTSRHGWEYVSTMQEMSDAMTKMAQENEVLEQEDPLAEIRDRLDALEAEHQQILRGIDTLNRRDK